MPQARPKSRILTGAGSPALAWPVHSTRFGRGPVLGMAAAFVVLLPEVQAEVRLSALFSDNAVLQKGKSIPVWGGCGLGEAVEVEFGGKTVTATVDGDRWMAKLPRQGYGGPHTMVVRGGGRAITLTNLMVGEVWVCSGQSNMEWPMSRSENPAEDIAGSANPNLRLFTVPKRKSEKPESDVKASWLVSGPSAVNSFSAVGYYFGRALQQAREVPVGLIHTSWGGSPAEVWMREEVLAGNEEFKAAILDAYQTKQRPQYEAALSAWEKEASELRAQGKPVTRPRPNPGWRPSELYNGMIAPLLPYAVAGAIWYQGESNAPRADQYARLFPAMIRNWRKDWGQNFPFLAVQLAPWDRNKKRSLAEITAAPGESDWAELREAQWIATQVLPKVGMAVITDVGDKDDIHPTKKRPVGERLALAARKIAYGERIVHSGPVFRRLRVAGDEARLSFHHVGGGLEARGGPLTGFQICGADRQWVWAEARIRGAEVVVTSPKVAKPEAVRFGWSDYPVLNLFNAEGLPASPFRTDNFPLTTAAKPRK